MKALVRLFPILLLVLLGFESCYYQQHHDGFLHHDMPADSTCRPDSLCFSCTHHYSPGYNFVVQVDSLALCTEIPSRAQMLAELPDSVWVYKDGDLVVAEIAVIPEDETDSIWVKVAHDQETQGWLRESELLPGIAPDDPISLAIYFFSGNHVWVTFLLVAIVIFVFCVQYAFSPTDIRRGRGRFIRRRPFFFVEICSPYPSLLRITLSGAAVFYASLQLFVADVWTDFYFYPTLNPFAVPPLLGAFLFSLWLLLLFFIAVVDDCLRQLSFGRSILYLLTTTTDMAILYLFFSLSTLVWVGFPLFVVFVVFTLYRYFRYIRPRFRCGKCGLPMHSKGICPRCGTNNE